jgi:hypothetical protein
MNRRKHEQLSSWWHGRTRSVCFIGAIEFYLIPVQRTGTFASKEKKRLHQLNSEYKFPRKHSISTRLPPLKIAERKKSWALEIPPGKVSFDQVTTYITWPAVVPPRDGEGSWRPVPGSAGERQKTRDAIAQALSSVCAACTGEMGSCCE